MNKLPITVVILTYNEEVTIKGCLESVLPYFSEVIVLDSQSTDATREIVKHERVRLETRKFDNYAAQRRHALDILIKKHKWVFFLDADERIPTDLIDELDTLVADGNFNGATLYRLRRKDYFQGRWLRRTSGYPTWFGRLCKSGSVKIEREINEQYHTNGQVGFLNNHLIHYPFMKGIHHWVERHNRYSTMEAEKLKIQLSKIKVGNLFSGDPAHRREELKKLFYALPFRPLIAFMYLYVLRLGFLDGRSGFLFCCLRAYYELLIQLKKNEKY